MLAIPEPALFPRRGFQRACLDSGGVERWVATPIHPSRASGRTTVILITIRRKRLVCNIAITHAHGGAGAQLLNRCLPYYRIAQLLHCCSMLNRYHTGVRTSYWVWSLHLNACRVWERARTGKAARETVERVETATFAVCCSDRRPRA